VETTDAAPKRLADDTAGDPRRQGQPRMGAWSDGTTGWTCLVHAEEEGLP
jgi:hypothetical protein